MQFCEIQTGTIRLWSWPPWSSSAQALVHFELTKSGCACVPSGCRQKGWLPLHFSRLRSTEHFFSLAMHPRDRHRKQSPRLIMNLVRSLTSLDTIMIGFAEITFLPLWFHTRMYLTLDHAHHNSPPLAYVPMLSLEFVNT